MTTATKPRRMWTVPELIEHFRVGADKVVEWIRSGQLAALDVRSNGKRAQYRVSPEALAAFEASRLVVATPKPVGRGRKRKANVTEYFKHIRIEMWTHLRVPFAKWWSRDTAKCRPTVRP